MQFHLAAQKEEDVRKIEDLMNMSADWVDASFSLWGFELNAQHKASAIQCKIKFGDETAYYHSTLVECLLDVQPLSMFHTV